jgi:hypothetical protein
MSHFKLACENVEVLTAETMKSSIFPVLEDGNDTFFRNTDEVLQDSTESSLRK